jgi:hypothetical protein
MNKKNLKDKLIEQLRTDRNWNKDNDKRLRNSWIVFGLKKHSRNMTKKDWDMWFEEYCEGEAENFKTDKDDILERMIYLGLLR